VRTTFAASGVRGSSRSGEIGGDARIALFLDVDGTLLDLAERPDEVIVPPGLVTSLAAAQAKTDGALALISGRVIADLDRLFQPLRFAASGVHGAELRLDPAGEAFVAPGAAPLPPTLWSALTDVLADLPGTFAENKRYSFAVHYREAPAVGDTLRARLARLVETSPELGVSMLEAHCAFELKTRQFDKGRAVAELLTEARFKGRAPVFIGDDDTDEAGIAAANASGGCGYSVGRRRPGARAIFASPNAVRRWLAAFAADGKSA